MHIVIFAGGTLRPSKLVQQAIDSADYCIAADSGAATALHYGCPPRIIVGDFDSLDPDSYQQLSQQGSQIQRAAVEKNETDTELAISTALAQGATSITLLGALGGTRFEHTIANIFLLAGFETTPIRIVDGPSICWLLRGPGQTTIEGKQGNLLSLFPFAGNAIGVKTNGLYYPLHSETLYFGKPRGVSNMLTQEHAEVSLEKGLLLVIHTEVEDAATQ